jgi:hypothetical protein
MLPSLNNQCMKAVVIITLLATLAGVATGCADFQPAPPPQPAEKPVVPKAPTTITTADSAIMVVYEHLLAQAEGYEAKTYLADFYATCDNWTATSELLKDGTSMWHVVVDMTQIRHWRERLYWEQASWLVLRDGKVIPSNRFKANALRIEADLQELSLPPLAPPGKLEEE